MKLYSKIFALVTLIGVSISGFSQIPPGYYDSAIGKDSTALQIALHGIIDNHTAVTYKQIKTTYHEITDKKANGQVWDMYSDIPGSTPPYTFTFIDADKCGNYANEGDCFNREHSFPQSWFNSSLPMQSDLFHVYPTDGKVNGYRSSFPFGEVSNPTKTTLNGSKLGPNTFPGHSGTCFEPLDEYKGDFARTYFYMAVRYYSEDNSWQTNDMVKKSQLQPWALQMLYQWHLADTVSQKELDRNEAVYGIQGNRNPFIDRPDWVDSLWFPTHSGVGISSSELEKVQIRSYPNPAQDVFHVFLDKRVSNLSMKVYSASGVLLKQEDYKAALNHLKVNTSEWKNGFYLVFIYDEQNSLIYQQKLIVL